MLIEVGTKSALNSEFVEWYEVEKTEDGFQVIALMVSGCKHILFTDAENESACDDYLEELKYELGGGGGLFSGHKPKAK